MSGLHERVSVLLVEQVVVSYPPEMAGWRFFRIEYSNGIETGIWLPYNISPESIERLFEVS